MKVICDQKILSGALKRVNRLIPARNSMPLVTCAKLTKRPGVQDSLRIEGTDLVSGIVLDIPARYGESLSATSVAVLGKSLSDIVAKLPAQIDGQDALVELESATTDRCEVKSGRSKYSLPVLSPEQFPSLPTEGNVLIKTTAGDLAQKFSSVISAVSAGDARHFLGGCLIHKFDSGVRIVATDGKRMHIVTDTSVNMDSVPMFSVIVPGSIGSRFGSMFRSDDEIECLAANLQDEDGKPAAIVFRSEHCMVWTRLIDGQFPDYDAVVGSITDDYVVSMDRQALVDAVGRLIVVAARVPKIDIDVHDNQLELSVTTPEFGHGSELVDCSANNTTELALNGSFLLDALAPMSAETVTWAFAGHTSPIGITGDDDAYKAVLMPMTR